VNPEALKRYVRSVPVIAYTLNLWEAKLLSLLH